MLFENNQLIVRYKLDDTDELHSFCVDIKDFDTPTINIYEYNENPNVFPPAYKKLAKIGISKIPHSKLQEFED